jgi:cytochrome d ubiquinol oxidase subunit I
MEAEWKTEKPPAAFTVIGIPDKKEQTTHYAVKVPWMLGLIARRSTSKEILGITDMEAIGEQRIRLGMKAYAVLDKVRNNTATDAERQQFNNNVGDLGYSLLLKKYTPNVIDATDEQIKMAAADTVPNVPVLFWVFRFMVAIGFFFIFLFVTAFYFCSQRRAGEKRWLLRMAFWSLPLPWIAAEFGWIVAEYGRQPWAIANILPTRLATSSLHTHNLVTSLTGFFIFYTALAVVEVYLMVKYARQGPSTLGTGKYHYEHEAKAGT